MPSFGAYFAQVIFLGTASKNEPVSSGIERKKKIFFPPKMCVVTFKQRHGFMQHSKSAGDLIGYKPIIPFNDSPTLIKTQMAQASHYSGPFPTSNFIFKRSPASDCTKGHAPAGSGSPSSAGQAQPLWENVSSKCQASLFCFRAEL